MNQNTKNYKRLFRFKLKNWKVFNNLSNQINASTKIV
jgi:hypothetical protein